MSQHKIYPECTFCGSQFSNYGNLLYSLMKIKEDEKTFDYYDDFDYNDVYKK